MQPLFKLTPPATAIRIASHQDQPNLSKGQKAFNTLVKKIEISRRDLARWQATVLLYQQKVASDYAPLVSKFRELQAAMAQGLDAALDKNKLTKTEKFK